MKNKHFIVYTILVLLSFSNLDAATLKSDIPLAVDTVTTKRVGKQLVRVVEYNTELAQKFSIELLSTPKPTLIQKLDITEIKVNLDGQDRILKFAGSSAVSIDHVSITNSTILFSVDYFGGGHTGSSITANCTIAINPNKLEKPECKANSTTK